MINRTSFVREDVGLVCDAWVHTGRAVTFSRSIIRADAPQFLIDETLDTCEYRLREHLRTGSVL